jgi:hypothetical protein
MIIMRKLLTLVLILAMASLASAASVDFYADGVKDLGDCITTVQPGASVEITVKADFNVIGLQMATTADGGTAPAVGTLNAGFTLLNVPGTLRNGVGTGTLFILIDKIQGGVPLGQSIAAGQVLYTFTWDAPTGLEECTTFTIGATPDQYPNPFYPPPPPNYTVKADGSQGELVNAFNPCTVNVLPEPMTIALLGLGGLFLRRRWA